jgi:anti-sigma-K factor RskA
LRHETLSDEVRERAALYALRSLSQLEARAFELHLQDRCPICEAELRECEKVVADLGIAAGETSPPEYLGDLLMARIERESVSVPSVRRMEPPAEKGVGPKSPGVAAPLPSSPGAWRIIVPWTVAAVLAAAALLAFYAWREVRRGVGEANERLAAAQQDNRKLRADVESEKARQQGLAQVAEFLKSPGARLIRLAGQAPAPTSSAVVLWNPQGNRMLVSANLPPAPQRRAYQLWLVTPTARISAGLIQPDHSGRIFTSIDGPRDVGQLSAVVVTLEPEGGSPQPTFPLYLHGKIL